MKLRVIDKNRKRDMMQELYFDYSATTPCDRVVLEEMNRYFNEEYGNPSSLHLKGMAAEQAIKFATTAIAKTLRVNEKEIIFTSGGTESDNLALFGVARRNRRRGNHLITTKIEHPAILSTMKALEEEGFEVTYLDVDENGIVLLDQLKKALKQDTILVSIMHVNNEIGSIQPIEEAAKIVHEFQPDIFFHVDAIQSYGKLEIFPKKIGVDLLSVSGHKIYGPKGIGFLYISERVKIQPIIFGGGQQRQIRSGTENVPGIVGIGTAAKVVCEKMGLNYQNMSVIKTQLEDGVRKIDNIHIHGIGGNRIPYISSISFEGIRSEVLLHALEERGVFVSAGSACASNKPQISPVLKAIGATKEQLSSTIRFSMGNGTTTQEVEQVILILKEIVPMLRKFTRK